MKNEISKWKGGSDEVSPVFLKLWNMVSQTSHEWELFSQGLLLQLLYLEVWIPLSTCIPKIKKIKKSITTTLSWICEDIMKKREKNTLPPGNDLIFQQRASFSGAYAADPMDVRTFGLVASAGTGNSISTFVAVLQSQQHYWSNHP